MSEFTKKAEIPIYQCTANERLFLDELKELYEWDNEPDFPNLRRKTLTLFSNIYQRDFKTCNLKELVNE